MNQRIDKTLGMSFTTKIVSKLFSLMEPVRQFGGSIFVRSWVLSPADTGADFAHSSLLYIGIPQNKDYLIQRCFDGEAKCHYLGRRWYWWSLRRFRKKPNSSRTVILEVAGNAAKTMVRPGRVFYLPLWISVSLDISQDLKKLVKTDSLRSDLRRLRKNGLSYRISKEKSEFHLFYREMYAPYVSAAHGTAAHVVELQEMMEKFHQSELLLVIYNEKPIAGGVILDEGNRARFWLIGVKEPRFDHMKLGGLSAVYYFVVQHLQQNQETVLNIGLCRPWLNDGVTVYKKKWQPEIVDKDPQGWLLIIPDDSKAVFPLLRENPFVHISNDELHGALFTDSERMADEKALCKDVRKTSLVGMKDFDVFGSEGESTTISVEQKNES